MGAIVWAIFTKSREPEIRHIVLISMDTTRADYLSCYGHPRDTTPHIDAVAEQATRFEHVVSPAPITLPAHCSMLTGTIPPFHGVHDNIGFQLLPANLTLAEILKKEGFGTDAIVSAVVLDRKLGLAQGFGTYNDAMGEESYSLHIGGNERKGDATTDLALDWIENNKDMKSFLFLHYYDAHLEYTPPEPYASEYSDALYAGEIAYVDHCIGRVIQKLKDRGMYDSTLLIITSDHGEMLGEHGEIEHAYFIYESAIRVPLIIKWPEQTGGVVVKEPVGLVDLVPTICSLLGIDAPDQVAGQDLSGMLQGIVPDHYERYIYSESAIPTDVGAAWLMAISTGQWKYIQAPRRELYDLNTDPSEERNLFKQEIHRGRILEDKLREILEQFVRMDVNSRIKLDAESIRRLESLGYVAGATDDAVEIAYDESQDDPKDFIQVYEQYRKAHRLFFEKKPEEAREVLIDLIPQRPEHHKIYVLLGDIALLQEDYNEAILQFRRARKFDPKQPDSIKVTNKMAWLQATRPSLHARDVEEAVLYAKRVCDVTNYRNPNALDTLAAAYAAAGYYDKAVATARNAHQLALEANHTRMALEIAKRLELFEQSKPYIEE
jgi:arylsulfatase A-like enzyme